MLKWMMLVIVMLVAAVGMAQADDKARLPGVSDLRASADKGNALAQNNLAVMYATGNGVTADMKEAARWYQKAAEQGYAVAQQNLGGLYESGRGIPQDLPAAAVWYSLAAEQGDSWGQLSLANLLANPRYAKADLAAAYRWFLIAARSTEKDVVALARAEIKKIGPKVSQAVRTVAEREAKVWRPNQ